jgi:predicted RNA-binding protein associated with RNAse of E/G family
VTQTFALQHHFRAYFWPGRRHTLLETYEPDGRLVELYADITSPIEIVEGEIHFIDHELDVIQYTGQEARIIDQDEFAEATERFGYADEFVRESYALAESLLDVLANWRPLGVSSNQVSSEKSRF